MNAKERMDYILNHDKYIKMYMDMHDEEVKMKKTFFQKLKNLFKGN